MSNTHKSKHGAGPSTVELEPRIHKALKENRTQQALELAKQLFKYEATPAHKDLLRTAYRERARQLREQGQLRDAATVLENLLPLCDDAHGDVLVQLARELARSGGIRRALELHARVADPALQARILGDVADAALNQGSDGRKQLSADLQTGFDTLCRAFEQAEAGQDDAARETLQAIGLQSPFLEWKVMLRGLLAYYQKDDAKAVENWQRLNVERLCGRLIAPLRSAIDSAYRTQQPPETQRMLQRQAERLQGTSLGQSLRMVQTALADRDRLSEALRVASGVLPVLQHQAPALVPRLAACFYWGIVQTGSPPDVPRYRRVFGAPPDDPDLHRLNALWFEHAQEPEQALEFWNQYQEGIAAKPATWGTGAGDPTQAANQVRALIWEHMGQLAAFRAQNDLDDDEDFEDDGDEHEESSAEPIEDDDPSPLGAEACFRKSIELAPQRLSSYQGLLSCYGFKKNAPKAVEVATQLLERFPDHVPTLEMLGRLQMMQQRHGDAIAALERALRSNPLDRRLRSLVGTAHTFHARHLAEQGAFAEARAAYQTSLAMGDERTSVLCKWAACEFKAGDATRGEQLIQEALAAANNNPLAVSFCMLIESIRFKLTKLKSRFDKEFKAGLAAPPTASAAVAVAETAASHHGAAVNYRGRKTHEKQVLDYLDKARAVVHGENELEKLCSHIATLDASKLLCGYAKLGQKRFPKNPFFPFHEAESYLMEGRRPYQMLRPLDKARKLAEKLPADDSVQALLDRIQDIRDRLDTGGLGFMRQMMNMFAGLDQDDVDDEDFEDFEDFDDFPIDPSKKHKPR